MKTSITVDFYPPPDNYMQAQYEMAMGDFNFKEVAKIMRLMDYKWRTKNGKDVVPSVKTIKKAVSDGLKSLIKNPAPVCYIDCGRLLITKCGTDLCVSFVPVHSHFTEPLYYKVAEQYRKDCLPPLIKMLNDEMEKAWWIGGLSYPANTSRPGVGENFVCLTGDGFPMLFFEVISLEGKGSLRYHNLYHDDEKGKDGFPTEFGRWIHQDGVRHGILLTFTEVANFVRTYVDRVNAKFHSALAKAQPKPLEDDPAPNGDGGFLAMTKLS